MATALPVLLVDDRVENLRALEALLEDDGYQLVRASSGEEALRQVLAEDFAVILMDVQMPGMNGFETAQLIKERPRNHHTPIIFLTAINQDERFMLKGYALGAVDYLSKPFDPEILRSKVRVFADLFQAREQLRDQEEKLREAEVRAKDLELFRVQQANERRYRELADAMPQIVWTTDPAGKIEYFNQRWFDYTGLSRGSEPEAAMQRALAPSDVVRYREVMQEALREARAFECEYRLLGADGAYRWHLARAVPIRNRGGGVIRWVGTATDIHERKEQQEELSRLLQTRFVERLIDTAPAGIAFVNPELVYRWVNPTFVAMVCASKEALIGRRLGEVTPDGTRYVEAVRRVVESGEIVRMHDFPQTCDDGTERFWDVFCYPVFNDDQPGDRIEGVLIFSLDVSARVQGAKLQAERISELQQVDKLKDEFLSILSHELRTPINFITGFGSILEDGLVGELTDQQRYYLKKMLSGADVLLSLINDLLDMSRIQAGKFTLFPRPIDFGKVVTDVVANIRPLVDQKRHELVTEVPPDLPTVVADDQRIAQILINLLSNAVKFTPEGGKLRVRASVKGDRVRCEVEDTGVGIAESDVPRLFHRFTQLDSSSTRPAGGTGLGLAITKTLVESHGGTIGVESEPGKGSTFWFEVPIRGLGAGLQTVNVTWSRDGEPAAVPAADA